MPITPAVPFPKGRGDTVRSADWNQTVQEVIRLDGAKLDLTGGEIAGGLVVDQNIVAHGSVYTGGHVVSNNDMFARRDLIAERDVLLTAAAGRLQITRSAPANEDAVGATIDVTGAGTGQRHGLVVKAQGAGVNSGLEVHVEGLGGNATGPALLVNAFGTGTSPKAGLQISAGGGGGLAFGMGVTASNTGDAGSLAFAASFLAEGNGLGPRVGLHVVSRGGDSGGHAQAAYLEVATTGADRCIALNVLARGNGPGLREGLVVERGERKQRRSGHRSDGLRHDGWHRRVHGSFSDDGRRRVRHPHRPGGPVAHEHGPSCDRKHLHRPQLWRRLSRVGRPPRIQWVYVRLVFGVWGSEHSCHRSPRPRGRARDRGTHRTRRRSGW